MYFYNKLKSIYNKNNQITNAKNILDKQTERPLLNQNRIMLNKQLIMKLFLKLNTVRDQSIQLLCSILKVVILQNTLLHQGNVVSWLADLWHLLDISGPGCLETLQTLVSARLFLRPSLEQPAPRRGMDSRVSPMFFSFCVFIGTVCA